MTVGDAPKGLPNTLGGMGSGATIALAIGSVVAGKFRIERLLAEGGMGLVVAATHLQLEQTVALKFFRGDLRAHGEPLLRFMREAKAAAQLKSEHVARMLDVGVTEGGTPYMVMEYLEGRGLEKLIATEGPLDVPSAAEYAIQACEGLAEAHSRGIIHRDIKPSNLFLADLSPGWRAIKILDFGISKVSLARASNITTHLNLVMGTPCYMSPEQLQSTAKVDHRTDIWSLGATLYESLTGSAPFDASLPLLALAEEIVSRDAPTVRQRRPDVPQELSAIVARCLTRDRNERFQSAAALAMALLPFARMRARVTAERAVSMTPAMGVVSTERSTAGESGPWAQWSVVTQDLPGTPTPPARVTTLTGIGNQEPPGPTKGDPAVKGDGTTGWWPPSRLTVAVAAATLICLVTSVLVTGALRQPRLVESSGAATSSRANAPFASSPALPELVVRAWPPSAQIMIDGAVVPGNPFRGRFPRGERHQIQAFAAGFEPKAEEAVLANDVVVNLSLDKVPSPVASAPVVSTGRVRVPKSKQSVATRGTEIAPTRVTAPADPDVVDPAGGRTPLRPIQTRNPYGSP
jgi:eukaryotic-like serine/threonine-protein kinase